MMYKLIALDMDGTLLNTSKEVLPETLASLKKAKQVGKYAVLSTGRNKSELTDYPELMELIDEAILVSGALIYDFKNDQVIESHPLSLSLQNIIEETVKEKDVMFQVHTLHHAAITSYCLEHLDDYGMSVYSPMYHRVAYRVDDIYDYMHKHSDEVFKINIYHRTNEERMKTYEALKDLPLDFAFAETTSLECSPQGINKGQGLEALSSYLDVDISETIAIGDADNDLEVLKKAGLSVAMGNANRNVKKICDIITTDNDHNGIGVIVEEYLIGEKK